MPGRFQVVNLTMAAMALLLVSSATKGQTDLRAHYADGQIWVIWEISFPAPDTYVVLGSDMPITEYAGGVQVGRPFAYEYLPGALQEQFGPTPLGWVVPSALGAGIDTLAVTEGLFVETVHEVGPRYFAVVAEGETTVVPGVNATTVPANGLVGSGEEVESHFQFETTPVAGYTTQAYAMWADGRQDPEDRRADFPICANAAKNGMPSIFLLSFPNDLPPGPRPVTHWLHGGEGVAKASIPGRRPLYDIDPDQGYLVAHNDDLVRRIDDAIRQQASYTWWFGWTVDHDPFATGVSAIPGPGEVIINYTQRRLAWIQQWLVRQGWVDPDRASVQGHSMGSAGAIAFAKAFPEQTATCTIFNNGFRGPTGADTQGRNLFGDPADSLLSNLVDTDGHSVPVYVAFDLSTHLSPLRDLPLVRSFHGKNDYSSSMGWGAFVVGQYVRADSLGWGMQLYWDERAHRVGSEPPGYWATDTTMTTQTQRDNADYQEQYAANQSFPAFYNHRLAPQTYDPGDGTPGTGGSGDGDDWGTWGGYHDWELDTLVDAADRWEATILLIGTSQWTRDNCPVDSLLSDMSIRKPQSFRPEAGELVDWWQIRPATDDTLRSGVISVDESGLVKVTGLWTYRDPGRTRVAFSRRTSVVVDSAASTLSVGGMRVYPNPFNPSTRITFALEHSGDVRLAVFDLGGRRVRLLASGQFPSGTHEVGWHGDDGAGRGMAPGVYFLRLESEGVVRTKSVTLIK